MIRLLVVLGLAMAMVLVTQSNVTAQAPPAVNRTTPLAVMPGQAIDLIVQGGNLADTRALWLSFPAETGLAPGIENNGQNAAQVTYRISLPADQPVGIGALRVVTPGGVSNLRLLMVDDLATVAENGQNKSLETAQPLTLPVAVDGVAEAESYDFYQFTAVAGQRISIEAVARRLGSPLDPVIRLLDATGRELAYSDDEPGLGADSRLAHEFDTDGTYYIEIRDIRYHGGGNHRYRLRVGDFPLVTTPFPLGSQRAAQPIVEFVGPAVLHPLKQAVALPHDGSRLTWIQAAYPHGHGSAMAQLILGDRQESIEFEPNDTPEQASPLTLPAAVNGRLEKPRDRDYYQFEAEAGQRFRFIGQTRSLGSPTDLFLRLYKADGSLLAEVDDSPGNEEGILDVALPEAGIYRLMVEDLHRRGGPDHSYRIDIEPYEAGFSLAVEGDTFNAPHGGVFVAKVTSTRRDYAGPITLSIEGGGEGLALANHVIAENQNETLLHVTAAASHEPGSWSTARIVGRAKVGETDFLAVASALVSQRGQFNGLPYPPARLAEQIAWGIGPAFPDFFKLSIAGDAVHFPQLIGTTTFEVHAERLNKFEEAIAVRVEGLPPGFVAEVGPLEKGKPSTTVKLSGPATAAEGTYRFRVVGEATFQNQPRQIVLDAVELRVVPPLSVALEATEPLPTGAPARVKVMAGRLGDHQAAIRLKFENLPLGVSAPEGLAIAEGQNEVEFELSVAPNAMLGVAEQLLIRATTQVQGRDIVIHSPARLELRMP